MRNTKSKWTLATRWMTLVIMILNGSLLSGQTIIIEAESGTRLGDATVANSPTGFSGTGFVTTFHNDGDGVVVSFNVANAADYTLSLGFRSESGGKDNFIDINGVRVDTVHFPQISTFTETMVGDFHLNQGNNTITFSHFWGWCDLDYFKISSVAPRGDFTITPSAPATGDTVTFDATNTIDPNGTIDSYGWNFGDGPTVTGKIVKHVFTKEGNKNISLAMTDNDNNTTRLVKTLEIFRSEPYALFALSDEYPAPSVSVAFDGSLSYDLTGTVDSWEWDFGDGNTATGVTTGHTYVSEGNYEVSLTVTNNRGKKDTKKMLIFVYDPSVIIRGPVLLTSFPSVYDKIELAFDIYGDYENPYDPDEVMVDAVITLPSGNDSITIPCFYFVKSFYRNGNWLLDTTDAGWRLRFTGETPGNYSVKLKHTDVNGIHYGNSFVVNVAASEKKGFVQIDPENKQFNRFTTGEAYFPVGINIGWPGYTIPDADVVTELKTQFDSLSNNNANWVRYWMVGFSGQALEWYGGTYEGLGLYNQRPAAQLDSLMDVFEEDELYVQLALFQHGMFSQGADANWDGSPYNTTNGGIIGNSEEYFYNAACKEYARKLLRYTIARWAYSTNIYAWEFFNEVNLTGSSTKGTAWRNGVDQWHDEMSNYVETLDPYNHIQTTSVSDDENFLRAFDDNESLDQLQRHYYENNNSENILTKVNNFSDNQKNTYQKPFIIGEYGRSSRNKETTDVIRQMNWNGFFKTVPYEYWFWDNVYSRNMYPAFKTLGTFINENDFVEEGNIREIPLTLSNASGNVDVVGFITDSGAYGYIYDTSYTTNSGVSLTLEGLDYGYYTLDFINPVTGVVNPANEIAVINFDKTIPIPQFTTDVVYQIRFKEEYDLPIALAGKNRLIPVGIAEVLDGSESFDPPGGNVNYSWNLIDKPVSSNISITNQNTPTINFTADKSGTYRFVLIVDNGTEFSIPDTLTILASTEPIANAGADLWVSMKKTILVDGTGSSDPDGDQLFFTWSVLTKPAGSNPSVINYDQAICAFKSGTLGEYQLLLVVNDGVQDGLADTVKITVVESLGVEENLTDALKVYPNPTSGVVYISSDFIDLTDITIRIFDMSGRMLKSTNSALSTTVDGAIMIDLTDCCNSQGLYLMRISSDKKTYVTKINLRK